MKALRKESTKIPYLGRWLLIVCVMLSVFMLQVNDYPPMKVSALDAPKPQGISITAFGAVGNGIKDDTKALVKASNLLSGTIYFPTGTYLLNDNLTFNSNLTLAFGENAKIQVASGKSLYINGKIVAGLYKIFGGQGNVAGTAAIKTVYPEWFGALGNSVQDDRPYIQAAVNYASQLTTNAAVHFSSGRTYILGTMTAPGQTFIQMPQKVSIAGTGTLKIANKIGVYNNVFEFKLPVKNLSITDITIDSNSLNNPISTKPTDAYNARREIMMYTGSGVKIANITVKNSHAIHSIMANVVADMTITGNRFLNMGSGATFFYDTSCMYLVGNNVLVSGNFFEAGGPGANTAIEVHGSTKNVLNNTISKYRTGIIYGPTDNPAYDNKDNMIAGNRIQKAVFGMSLWASIDHVGTLTIKNNNIVVNARGGGFLPTNAAAAGIQFYNKGNYSWTGLSILNNFIDFENPGGGYMTLSPNAAGIDLSLYSTTANITDMRIRGNMIRNSYSNGITWNVHGVLTDVTVEKNTIVNAGSLYSGKDGNSAGIALLENRLFRNVLIQDNSIEDNRTPSKMYTGMLLRSIGPLDNASTQLFWTNNSIVSASPMLSGSLIITEGNTPVIIQTPFYP
ncbi:glycosyl hydrolase family 28-related protein [Paenibacillus taiwanensis]|uniref:glycosyl hydrolase family 28-related protein n=1 Tax=Paenibacillus taiwanensis TaxID=401638 RepID=UPI00048C32BA|nr:glycosyl hydrolase family 28-related protein [Paenibacillus taiwanensis]